MIDCPSCGRRHRSYLAAAECRFKGAAWVHGNDRYALVACGGRTVTLWATVAEAEESKEGIDATGCGGRCNRWHSIVDLGG